MGNAQIKDFLAGKEEAETYLRHFMHPEVLNHSKYLSDKWHALNIAKQKDYENFFDWSNVQATANLEQVQENINLQEKKENLLVGMFPKKNSPDLTNPSFFDEIQVSFTPSEVAMFRDRQNQKFFVLYQIYYIMQNYRRRETNIVKSLKEVSSKDQIPKAAEIGIRSGVQLIIGLLREAAEHNPKLKDETLNFLLDLFAEVKPLSLWGTNKIDSVLDKSLHTVSDYLEELIQSDRTTPESKCKALKVLFSLGLLRGSLPNLLSVVDLLNKLKLDVDVSRELKLLRREKAGSSLGFGPFKSATKAFFKSAVKQGKEGGAGGLAAASAEKSPHTSITTDGKFLYVHNEVEGLLKIGTGYQYTMFGKVYIHKPDYRIKERGSLVYILGKLYYRSAKVAPLPLIEIDPNTLEEKSTLVVFDNLAPNCLYPEMTSAEIELPHAQTNQSSEEKEEKRSTEKTTATTTSRLPASLKRDIRLLRPSQRSPAFTEGRYLYIVSQWTVDVQRRGGDSDDEDESEQTETKQARYGIDIYDPLKEFEHVRCVELFDTTKPVETKPGQKPKAIPPLNAKLLDEGAFATNGSQLLVGVPIGVEGNAATKKFKTFDLQTGELLESAENNQPNFEYNITYDPYNNVNWGVNDTKKTFDTLVCFKNVSLPPKFIYPEDSEFYTPYENDEIIEIAGEGLGLIEDEEAKKSRGDEAKQEDIQTLLSLGFHVSSKKFHTGMIQLQNSENLETTTKSTELFILGNIARLAESYATLEYSSYSKEDLLNSIRRPYSVQLTDKVFTSLLSFLEDYGKSFFAPKSSELDDDTLYEQCSFLSCLRVLKYNLAALENFSETLNNLKMKIVDDDFAPRLKDLVWKILESTPFDNKEAEEIRIAIYNEALSIFSYNLSVIYPDFKDILKLLKNHINKIDDPRNKDIVKSILFWLKNSEHIIQLVKLVLDSDNSTSLIEEIKSLIDIILTWETNSFSHFLRSASHPKDLHKYSSEEFLDVSASFVVELQKELIYQLGHKMQEKHLEMTSHHVLLFKLNESICKTAIVMNSEIQEFMIRVQKVVEEEIREKDREEQEEEKAKEALRKSPYKKKKKDEKEPLWKKIDKGTKALWQAICDTYTDKVYFSYLLSFQVNSLSLLSSHFLIAAKTLKHISTFLVSLNNLYNVRQSLEKAVTEKMSLNLTEKSEAFESAHPYPSRQSKQEKINIPGAKSLTINFDPKCAFKKNSDYIQFFSDEKYTQQLTERLGGFAEFPKGPLNVQGDTVYFTFHSANNNTNSWGYKFTVTASIESHGQADWMLDLHRSSCWLAGKCAAQLISGAYLQQALLGDEEQKYNNLLNSKLFSGGMEKCYFGSGKEGVWIELSDTMNEFQAGHLIEYLSSDMTETEAKEEEFLNHIIDGHSNADIEKLLDFLQKQFSKAFVWSNLGGENAARCVRAAFAVIVKHGGLINDINEGIKEIESEEVKKGKLTPNLKNLLKKWQAASRMRTWLVEKKKDIDDSIEKSKHLSERPAAAPKKSAQNQAANDASKGKKVAKKARGKIAEEKVPENVPAIEREEAPKASEPLQIRDSGEIIDKLIDQIVKKAQFLCQLIPAKHWSTDKTEERDKHLLFRASSQIESENKEEEWKRRLQQWKSVRESKQVYKSLEDETQEIHLSLTTSVLLCLQSAVSIKRLRKQVECSYLRAICRTIGVNALTSILVGATSSLFREDLVGWLCSALKGSENKLYHFTDNLQGSGHFLESTVNTAFKKLLVAIVKSMATSNDSDEIKSMLEALKWKYHGDDHVFLADIDLFGLLRGGSEHKLLRSTWGRSMTNSRGGKSDPVMVKKLLNLFETMVILCIGKLNWKRDETSLSQPSLDKNKQLPALEKHMSYVDEASIDTLLKQAFSVIFSELNEANINYKDFTGIDWAAYLRTKRRKELQEEKKKKKKTKKAAAPAATGFGTGLFGRAAVPVEEYEDEYEEEYDDYGNPIPRSTLRQNRDRSRSRSRSADDDELALEIERELRGIDKLDDGQGGEINLNEDAPIDHEEEREEEKTQDEPEEEEKKDVEDDNRNKGKKKSRKDRLRAIIDREERLLKEMEEKLYNPEFLYRLLMLLYKCVTTGSDYIWAAVGNPKYVSILLNLLMRGPPPHQALIVKILAGLLENLPMELFIDSMTEYNEKGAAKKLENGQKKEEIVLLDFFGDILLRKRKHIFKETLEYLGDYTVTCELIALFRSLTTVQSWSGSVREWLRANLQKNSDVEKQIAISILGGDFTGLRYGGRVLLHTSDRDSIFESNILLKETEEDRTEEATIVGFTEDYKEKKQEDEKDKKKEEKKPEPGKDLIYLNIGPARLRNNPLVLLDTSINKETSNFSSIELTTATRFNTVAIDSVPFQFESFPLKQNMEVLKDFFNWAVDPSDIPSLSSESLYLKATTIKSLAGYLAHEDNVNFLLKEHKPLIQKLMSLSKMQIISSNPTTLEVTEERLHRLLVNACEGGVSLSNPKDLTTTVKNKELVVLFGKDFSVTKFNIVSGYNLEKVKGFFELEPLSSKVTVKNAPSKAILIDNSDIENPDFKEIVLNAAIVVTANYDLQKFVEHYESQQKAKAGSRREAKNIDLGDNEIISSKEEKSESVNIVYPKCIVNVSERAFTGLLKEYESQKNKEYKNVFTCKKLVDELVDFGFPREICEKYFEQNYGLSIDVAIGEIAKLVEQEEEERKGIKTKTTSAAAGVEGMNNGPEQPNQPKNQQRGQRGPNAFEEDEEEEKKEFTQGDDGMFGKGKGGKGKKPFGQGDESDEDKKVKPESEDEEKMEMDLKKKKAAAMMMGPKQPVKEKVEPKGGLFSKIGGFFGAPGAKIGDDEEKKEESEDEEEKIGEIKERKSGKKGENKSESEEEEGVESQEEEFDEGEKVAANKPEFEIEKEDPNPCFKCKSEKDMTNVIEEKNKLYDELIDFEDTNDIGKLIVFKHLNYNILIFYARRAVLNLLEKWPKEVENDFLVDEKSQGEFLGLIKRLSIEAIFSSCSFGNNDLLNRIKNLFNFVFSAEAKSEQGVSFVDKLFQEHVEQSLNSLEKIVKSHISTDNKDAGGKFNTRLPSEIDIEHPCLDYSLWVLQNMLNSPNVRAKALKLDILYTLFGLIPAIKNKDIWGVLVFCLKVVNAVRENLSIFETQDKNILNNEKVKSLYNYFFLLKNKEKVESLSRRTQLLSELIINLNRLQKEIYNSSSAIDTPIGAQLDLNKFKVVDNLTDIVELMENYQNSNILLASSWLHVNSNILVKEQKVIESEHFYQKNLHTYKIQLENASAMNIKFSEESMTDEGDSIIFSSDPEGRLSVHKVGGDLAHKSVSFPAGSCYVHFPVRGGDIFAFGVNDQYQYSSDVTSSAISILESFSKYNTNIIDAGETHTAIVNAEGELYTIGTGNQTGSSSGSVKTFTKVAVKDRVKTLACGSNYTIFATEANELYGFGNNAEGRCGLSWNAGYASPQLIDFGTSKVVKQISCGNNHTLISTEDRNVYGSGGNENGQLGITDEYGNSLHGIQTFRVIPDLAKKNVLQVNAGHTFSLILVQEGGKTHLMSAGESAGGKLGLGSSPSQQVRKFTRLNALDGVGVNYIHAKKKHCIAVTKKGDIYSWGIGESGQLGHGDLENKNKPKLISFFKDKVVLSATTLYNSTLVIAKSKTDETTKTYICGENITLKGKEKSKEKLKVPTALEYFDDKVPIKIHNGANHAFILTKPVDIPAQRETHKVQCELTNEPIIKGPLFVDILNKNKTYSIEGVNDPKYKNQISGILLFVREALASYKDIVWPVLEPNDENEYLEKSENGAVFNGKTCNNCQITPISSNLYVSLHQDEVERYQHLCEACAYKILEGNVSPSLYFRVTRPLKKDLPTFPRSQFHPQSDTYGYVMTLAPSYNEKGYNYLTEKYQDAFENFASDMKNLKPEIDEQTVDMLNNLAQKQEKTVFDLNENISFPREELSVRTAIEKCSNEFLRKRFLILKQFNQKFKNILPFIDFSAKKDTLRLRNIYSKCSVYIFWDVKSELFEKILTGDNKTTVPNANNSGIKVKVNRMRASKFIGRGKPDHTGEFTVMGQIFQYFKNVGYGSFKVGKDAQPFAVQFVGEAAIDVGGPYREAISQICTELQSAALPLLIPSPNQKNDSGQFREKWVLNPSANSIVHFKMYEFLGVIMGTSIRSKNFLNLDLPSFVWKQLVDVPLNRKDLENIDRYLIQCLDDIINIHKKGIDETQFSEIIQEKYVTTLSDGREVELIQGGKNAMLTFESRNEWAELVEKVRLDESKKQAEAIRKGLSLVVPEGLLNLLTWRELETLVCGKPILDVDLLKTNTVYRGCSESDAVVEYFWKALTEYTPEERSMYLRFVWGRSRLPLTSKDFPSPHQIEILRTGNRDPDIMLPVAHTCFFSIELPKYTSYEILRDKLKYAITHCQAIDTDGRAYDIWDDDDNF